MPYDLLIRNGTVIDGSGLPRYRADVGVKNGTIAAIGRIRESAQDVIDAEGHVVAPGSCADRLGGRVRERLNK